MNIKTCVNNAVEETAYVRPTHVSINVLINRDLEIEADVLWINVLLQNLIANAYDHIPIGRQGRVLITAKEVDEMVLISIEDNGEGVLKENLERIFEAGFTTKRRNFTRLTGIGLFFCRGIARDHGGTLTASSEIGEWTRFDLHLPIKSRLKLGESRMAAEKISE